jgi:hypothetical protein
MDIKVGDSVYVRSKGWISDMIVFVSSGGKSPKDCPSHEARVNNIEEDRVRLIEVIFSGKRYFYLDEYIKQGAKIWVKRDNILTSDNTEKLLDYLRELKVKNYDYGLIAGFLLRFILRKLFPLNWDWVIKVLDSRIAFVCSEYQNAGRRFIGMDIKENETPYDNMRKVPAEVIWG